MEILNKKGRLQYLIGMSKKGKDIPLKTLAKRREKFEKIKYRFVLIGKNCYCCNREANHRHHILPLKRGGNNDVKNIVILCTTCHQAIHPWMVYDGNPVQHILCGDRQIPARKALGKKRVKTLSGYSGVVAVAAA